MEHFLQTAFFAGIVVIIALCLLGIGWIITGKQKIKGGTCGRDPTKKKDDSCGTPRSGCSLCNQDEEDKGKKQ